MALFPTGLGNASTDGHSETKATGDFFVLISQVVILDISKEQAAWHSTQGLKGHVLPTQ